MNLSPRCFILLLALLLVFPSGLAAQETGPTGDGPEIPPGAHEKAIEALKRLGPERGAKKIDFHMARIMGLARGIEAKSKKIQEALRNLNAEVTETEIRIDLSGDILFGFDRWDIRSDAEETLKKIAGVIRAYKSPQITVSGHTDSKGPEDYNQRLSEKRARAVKQWFTDHAGIDPKTIKAVGFGETRPKVPNTHPDGSDDPEGRQKNRRVEIRIKKSR